MAGRGGEGKGVDMTVERRQEWKTGVIRRQGW
jgi:hypothetical protein